MTDYLATNRNAWNARAAIHLKSEFYQLDRFLAGESSLSEIEQRHLGPIDGHKLLHLQCHFGQDTLSLARLGAHVTGVDLSEVAIDRARKLATQTQLEAQFICQDLYSFGEKATPEFDQVFTSYGVVCWLPDIERWAQTVAASLKPGGKFYIAEFHPIYDLIAGYSYFHHEQPDVEEEVSYGDDKSNPEAAKQTIMVWSHPLSDVINALIRAGIRIDELHEYPYSPYPCFDKLEERESGRFYLQGHKHDVPLVYVIKGTKT
ncbi:class I SAM-dependent methyltransferase [Corallincola platygyrae]|uniref:Class I SAM-dependent methyltransferase n=1 Tax=Corallincola platygyrae TaxID=1193278 RepID=A0ABW4XSZ5_9GAMM